MIHNAKVSFFLRLIGISLFFAVFGLCGIIWGTEVNAQVQNGRPKAAKAFSSSAATQQPAYSDLRGVTIGISLPKTLRLRGVLRKLGTVTEHTISPRRQ